MIIEALAEAAKARKEMVDKAKGSLKPGLEQFMTDHPELEGIRWTQYAPHFNDGEPCEFAVHDIEACLKAPEEDDEEGWHGCYGSHRPEEFSASTWKDLCALNKLLQKSEDVLRDAFGNDCRVIVTKKGVATEEYEHD